MKPAYLLLFQTVFRWTITGTKQVDFNVTSVYKTKYRHSKLTSTGRKKRKKKSSKEHWKVTARKEKPAQNDGQVCILTDEYCNVEVINNLEINIFCEEGQGNKGVWRDFKKKNDGKTLKEIKTDKSCEEFAVRKLWMECGERIKGKFLLS